MAHPTDKQTLAIRVRDTLLTILETGDIVGHDNEGRTILQLKLDELQMDELAAIGAELEDLEPEPVEASDDGPGVEETPAGFDFSV